MVKKCSQLGFVISAIMVISLLFSACTEPASEVVEKEVTRVVQETVVEKETVVKTAEVLQVQYEQLGVDVSIEQQEYGVCAADVAGGNYTASVFRYLYSEADILWLAFHNNMMDVMNLPRVTDPKLDELLDATHTTVDPKARQEAVNEAQRYLVEQALIVPIYTHKNFIALNDRVEGALFSPANGHIHWEAAYIPTE